MGVELTGTPGTTARGASIGFAGYNAGLTVTANQSMWSRFMPQHTMTVDQVVLSIIASSGNLDVGIWNDDGTGNALGTKVVSLGSTAAPGTGRQAFSLGADFALSAGAVYWFAYVPDNGTLQVASNNQGGRLLNAKRIVSNFPLAASPGAFTSGVDQAVCFELSHS